MDVREKLIEICFREFCDLAGDSPCGCDGCPYGEYDHDNGGCYVEYKKGKIEKLENDMDKYHEEDNGVTVQEWIPVKDRLPDVGKFVLIYNEINGVRLDYHDGATFGYYDVTHWMPLPEPPEGE